MIQIQNFCFNGFYIFYEWLCYFTKTCFVDFKLKIKNEIKNEDQQDQCSTVFTIQMFENSNTDDSIVLENMAQAQADIGICNHLPTIL